MTGNCNCVDSSVVPRESTQPTLIHTFNIVYIGSVEIREWGNDTIHTYTDYGGHNLKIKSAIERVCLFFLAHCIVCTNIYTIHTHARTHTILYIFRILFELIHHLLHRNSRAYKMTVWVKSQATKVKCFRHFWSRKHRKKGYALNKIEYICEYVKRECNAYVCSVCIYFMYHVFDTIRASKQRYRHSVY